MANRTNLIMGILIALVVILAVIVLYAFLVKPQIQGYAVQQQTQGANSAVLNILQTVAYPNCGVYPFTIGNQTITLASLECVQAAQQAQATKVAQVQATNTTK